MDAEAFFETESSFPSSSDSPTDHTTMVPKLTPAEHRALQQTAVLNGHTYSYVLAEPTTGPPLNTIFLVHGFPDFSFAWRNQIPLFTSLGLRVVAMDMMGYSGSDAPEATEFYTLKRAAEDIAALAAHLGLSSIILGGHDWGGAVVYRTAMHHPKLVSAFFSVCTPFTVPTAEYVSMTSQPNWRYQLQFGGYLKDEIQGPVKIRQFLNAMFGGRGPEGKITFDVEHGCYIENLPLFRKTRLLSEEELDYYAEAIGRNGMHGPTAWYRTGELNWRDEVGFARGVEEGTFRFEMPVLYVGGLGDQALPPRLMDGMEGYFRGGGLVRGVVRASHWALWEDPEGVNGLVREWLVGQIAGKRSRM